MKNPYISNTFSSRELSIRDELIKQLPNGIDTTADLMLEFMTKSDNEQLKDVATFMKISKKLPEMKMVFNFVMDLLKPDVVPIRSAIYDAGLDGIKELKEYMIDKYGKNEKMKIDAKVYNFINWLLLRLPAKKEMERYGLIFD